MKTILLAGVLATLGWAPFSAPISTPEPQTPAQCVCPVVNEARVTQASGKCRPAGGTVDVPCVSMSTPTYPDGDAKDGRCHVEFACPQMPVNCTFSTAKFDVTMASCARACGFTPNSPMDVRYTNSDQSNGTLGLSPNGTQTFTFKPPADANSAACGAAASVGAVEVKNSNGIVAFKVEVTFQCGNCTAANPNGGGNGGGEGGGDGGQG